MSKIRESHRSSVSTVCCFLALLLTILPPTHHSLAQQASPKPNLNRPLLPSSFDRTAVQGLLDGIDEPRAASTLKRGYFARRDEPDFPFDQALSLVSEAIAKEPVGSKRWFELQNVRGYAILRSKVSTPQEGISTYSAIFDAADKAVASDALYPLRISIAEYAGYIGDPNKKDELQGEPQVKVTLLKAWNAYALTAALPMKGRTAPPNFTRAFAVFGSDDDTLATVVKTLSDPKTPRSFELLVAGAALVAPKKPEQALAWLKDAKPLLPSSSTQDPALARLTVNATARYYDLLVGILQSNNRLEEAIAAQRERIVRTGGGYGPLWGLLGRTGDSNGQNAVLSKLKSSDVPGREALRAANTIGQFSLLDDPLPGGTEAAAGMLQAFLSPGRTRTPEEEMQARLWLGAYYLRRKEVEKARAVVVMPEPKQLTSSGRAQWTDLQRLQKAVATPVAVDKE